MPRWPRATSPPTARRPPTTSSPRPRAAASRSNRDRRRGAANFPRLAPSYMCMSDECPLIGSVVFNLTVQLDGRPYSVAVDAYFMEQHPDQVPRPLIEATQAIDDIFNHAAW